MKREWMPICFWVIGLQLICIAALSATAAYLMRVSPRSVLESVLENRAILDENNALLHQIESKLDASVGRITAAELLARDLQSDRWRRREASDIWGDAKAAWDKFLDLNPTLVKVAFPVFPELENLIK